MKILAFAWIGGSLSALAGIHFYDWKLWVIVLPAITLVVVSDRINLR